MGWPGAPLRLPSTLDLPTRSDDNPRVAAFLSIRSSVMALLASGILAGVQLAGCAPTAAETPDPRPSLAPAAQPLTEVDEDEPPVPMTPAEKALVRVCADACYLRDQHRAVSAELIRRQCETGCRIQLSWPLVNRQAELPTPGRSYVRLQGTLTQKEGVPAVKLEDGTVIALRIDYATAGKPPTAGPVAASGRLEEDQSLTTLNVASPTETLDDVPAP